MLDFSTNAERFSNDIMEEIRLFACEGIRAIDVSLFLSADMKCTVTVDGIIFSYACELPCGDELQIKRLTKRFLKLCVYRTLAEKEGARPWGSLTGVRPTKLAYERLAQGGRLDGVADYLTKTFFVSERKAQAVVRIVRNQLSVLPDLTNAVNLYVHVPFCNGRCVYCSFPSADVNRDPAQCRAYVGRLCEEITAIKEMLARQGKRILSVYVGGGTPSVLEANEIAALLHAVDLHSVEFTFEAGRPDSLTDEKLVAMREGGVTRVCINPQTLHDRTLKLIGRRHTTEQFYEAFRAARRYGFDINTDLIAGLEGETARDFAASLDGIYALRPENVTVHTLSRKRGSDLADRTPVCADIETMTDYAYDVLTKTYEPYYLYRQKYMVGNLENIGFCLSGKASLNNITVMEESVSVVACGAGSISKKITGGHILRHASPKDVKLYLNEFDERLRRKIAFFEESEADDFRKTT